MYCTMRLGPLNASLDNDTWIMLKTMRMRYNLLAECTVCKIATCQRKGQQETHDGEEPVKVLHTFAWYANVHTPETGDQIHRNQDRTKRCKFGQDIVDLVVGISHLN